MACVILMYLFNMSINKYNNAIFNPLVESREYRIIANAAVFGDQLSD